MRDFRILGHICLIFREAIAEAVEKQRAYGGPSFVKLARLWMKRQTNRSLKRSFQNGVLLTAAYTYSKSIDENTDDDTTPLFNAVAYQYRNRAVSDFDRRHVFNAGFTAELPFGRGHYFLNERGVAAEILGGWKINAIVSAYTGLPFTPTASATSLNAPFNTQVANQINPHVATLGELGNRRPGLIPARLLL